MDELTKALTAMVEAIMEKGADCPILAVAVAINGTLLYVRYDERDETLTCTPLAEHIKDDGLELPINVMYVDREGEAYQGIISVDGRSHVLN
jgi:hypothetical protein